MENEAGIITRLRSRLRLRKLAAFLIIMVLLTAGCGKKEAPKPKENVPSASTGTNTSAVQQKILSFNLEGLADNGAKKWDVTGESAEAVSETEVKLDNIVARAYGDEANATITADKGVYNKTQNNVRLEKNVKATIEGSQGLTQDFGGFPQPGDVLKGQGKPVDKNKKTKTVITCDGEVQFDYEKNQAYFAKNVKVVSEDGDIDADKITVNLDISTKKIRNIIAEGNVKITRGDNLTYSDQATYFESEKKIVLTGQPKLIIYQEGGLGGVILDKK